jgi:1-acyl-sn-glycerol-3-phosphate acyltransferase
MSPWLAHRWYDTVFWTSSLAFTFGWSLRVVGRRNMPTTGPVLVVANHQSFFDPVLCGIASRRYLTFMARETLFQNPFLAKLIRSLDAFPIDNQGLGREGLQRTMQELDKGKAVLVFPEGERTWDGAIQPFMPGISLLIRRVKAPIVPIGIAGVFAGFPRTAKLPRPAPLFLAPWAGTIALSVGKPIDPAPFAKMAREEMLHLLQDAVAQEWRKADRIRRQDRR